jgi:hypothetical protein
MKNSSGHHPGVVWAKSTVDLFLNDLAHDNSAFSIGAVEIAKLMSEQIADSAMHPNAALAKETP